jgi:hypothetical protein
VRRLRRGVLLGLTLAAAVGALVLGFSSLRAYSAASRCGPPSAPASAECLLVASAEHDLARPRALACLALSFLAIGFWLGLRRETEDC